MSHPRDDELVDLAIGDGPRDEAVSAHLDTCAECTAAVAQLRRAAGLVAASPPYAAWQAPGDGVWDRISAQLTTDDVRAIDTPGAQGSLEPTRESVAETTRDTSDEPSDEPAATTTPVTAASRAGRHTDEVGARRSGRSRGRAIGWGAGIAAAALAIGLVAGRAIWQPETAPQPLKQVALSTLDTKQDEGEASVVRSGQGLDLTVATARPLDAGDGYLEVWLLNADGKRMVSVGVLGAGDEATFPISQSLIDEGYTIVDISREQFDDEATHSGDSLLRGRLPA